LAALDEARYVFSGINRDMIMDPVNVERITTNDHVVLMWMSHISSNILAPINIRISDNPR
jgi:hypothetical protein